jgi:excisionase family DNA binding protein
MTTPSKTTMTTDRSPDNPAADATGVAVPVQAPQTDPASKTTVSAEINAALQVFVRALAQRQPVTGRAPWPNSALKPISQSTRKPMMSSEKRDPDQLLSVKEAADVLGVSVRSIWRLLRASTLRKRKILGATRIKRRDLDDLSDKS